MEQYASVNGKGVFMFHNPPATTESIGKKSNKAFMILSALGILFVVDVHLGQPLSVFTCVFPYDSFFMPMFAFISGYFFKESTCQSWNDVFSSSISKFRKLLLPYLGWVIFYNCLSEILFRMELWNIRGNSVRDLIYSMVTSGVTSAFNSPAWFAPLLFVVSVSYCFIRWLFRKIWNDHAALIIFITAGTAAIAAAGTSMNIPLHYMLLKVPFFLQFYYIGSYFRKYLEKPFDQCSTILVCLVSVFFNIVLIHYYGQTIEFPICSSMSGFHSGNLILPLITSVTGTAFWLKIAKALVPLLGQNRLINYISDNTFFIMTHHIGVKHLFIGLCIQASKTGLTLFSGIDTEQFLSDGLYLYTAHNWCAPVCFAFTMIILLLSCKALDPIRNIFRRY